MQEPPQSTTDAHTQIALEYCETRVTKNSPGGNKSDSASIAFLSEALEHQNTEYGRNTQETRSNIELHIALNDIKTLCQASQAHKNQTQVYIEARPCMAVITPDHTWFKWNNKSICWLKHPPIRVC